MARCIRENKDIQEKSRVISGYTSFVEKVRTYEREETELKDAVERAIDECIREDILAEFFKEHFFEGGGEYGSA